jgi:hypothetical protein
VISGWTLIDDVFGASIDPVPVARAGAGTCVGFYTDVKANYEFTFVRAGRLLRDFDPFDYSDFRPGETKLRAERGIGFADTRSLHPTARSLLLIYRLTGVSLAERDFDTSRFALGTVIRY